MANSRIKLWSIGGGKGGIGKSIVTLGIGLSLARLGKKVILIDADLGGANLHTLMGIRYPHVTVGHFLSRKVKRLEETVIETPMEGIGVICGADDILGAANPTHAQKMRFLAQIHELPAQYVLLDLGAGTTFNLLDFFNYSPGKIVLFTSQATSLQNAYGFIKSALFRKLSREFAKDDEMLNLLYQSGDSPESGTQSIRDLLAHFQGIAPEKYSRLNRALADFQLFLIVNMVRTTSDLKSPEIIRAVCEEFLEVHPEILGQVAYDPAVETGAGQMNPAALSQNKGKATVGLNEIAMRLVKESRLPRSTWPRKVGAPEAGEAALDGMVTQPSYT